MGHNEDVQAFLGVVGWTESGLASFAVRRWLTGMWRQVLDESDPSPHVVFQAGPGYGKTVAAIQFCCESLGAGSVTAAAFFRAGDFRATDPESVTTGIAMQLARLLPGFEAELDLSRREGAASRVDVHVGDVSVVTGDVSGAVTGVSVRVEQGRVPSWYWERDLATPLRNLKVPPTVIVFDGLDETTDAVRSMIAEGLGSLPPTVQVLVTSRPSAALPVTDPEVSQRVRHLAPAGETATDDAVISQWVRDRLLTAVEDVGWATRLSDRVAAAAGGIFLYAYHVTTALLPRLREDLPDPRDVPLPTGGLPGVYDAYLTRRFGSRDSTQWRTWGRSVLGPLAVSRGLGLTPAMIGEVGSLDLLSVQDALDDAGQFLYQDAGSEAWSIWHRSFADYLISSQNFTIAPAFWHERLGEILVPLATASRPSSVRQADYRTRYAVANVAEHVLHSGGAVGARVAGLLETPRWVEAAAALLGAEATAAILRRLQPLGDGRVEGPAGALEAQAHCLTEDVAQLDGQLTAQLSVWAAQSGDRSLAQWTSEAPLQAMWSSSAGVRAQKVLTRHPGQVTAAAVLRTPDDTLIVTAGPDGLVRAWSTTASEVAFTWREPAGALVLSISCEENTMLVGSATGTTVLSVVGGASVLWSEADGPVRATLIVDGIAVTSHGDGELKARELLHGSRAGDPPRCAAPVLSLASVRVPGRGQVVVAGTASPSGQCAVWDPAANSSAPEIRVEKWVSSLVGDSGLLVAGTWPDCDLVVFHSRIDGWDKGGTHTLGRTRRMLPESVCAVALFADEGVTAIAGDTSGRIHRVRPGQQAPVSWVAAHAGEVSAVLPLGGSEFASVGMRDGLVKLWSLSDLNNAAWVEQVLCIDLVGDPGSARAVACGHVSGEVSLRALETGQLLCRVPVHDAALWSMAWAGQEIGLVTCASNEVTASMLEGVTGQSLGLRSSPLLETSGQVSCVTTKGAEIGVSTLFSELCVVQGPDVVTYPPFGGLPLWLRLVTVASQEYLVVQREISREIAVANGEQPGWHLQVWPRIPSNAENPVWRQWWDDPHMLAAWTTAVDDGVPVIIEGLRDGAVVLFDLEKILADPTKPQPSYYQRHESWPSRSPVTAVAGTPVDGVLCLAWATLDGWLYVERTREEQPRRLFVGSQVVDLRISRDGRVFVGSTSGVLALRVLPDELA